MKKILLVCSAGMSTSLLEQSMNKYIKKNQIQVTVQAMPSFEAKVNLHLYDIILLGPQVRFEQENFKEIVKDKNIPIDIIPANIYALAKGEETLKIALNLLNQK